MSFAYPSRVLLTCILLWATGIAHGQTSTKKTIWQKVNGGSEFMMAIPEGYTSLADQDYTTNGVRVDKRIIVSRFLNGVLLLLEVYSGDIKRLEENLIKDLTKGEKPFSTVKNEASGAFTIKDLRSHREKFFETQQFFRSKKYLYVVKALAPTETDPIATEFLGSVRLGSGTDVISPNGTASLTDIAEIITPADDTPLLDKPDRDVVILMKPRPGYPADVRASNLSGTVELKILFSAAGTVKDIVPVSGPKDFWKASADAASKIRFLPALKDGRQVSTWKKISYSFMVY